MFLETALHANETRFSKGGASLGQVRAPPQLPCSLSSVLVADSLGCGGHGGHASGPRRPSLCSLQPELASPQPGTRAAD